MKFGGNVPRIDSQAAKLHLFFSNALRTTRSTCPRWIGFSEDDSFARLAKGDRLLPLARRGLGGGRRKTMPKPTTKGARITRISPVERLDWRE
jgi:hypothetical protein